MNKIDS